MDYLQPTITKMNTLKIVGIKYLGKNENNEITNCWVNFLERLSEIKHKTEDENFYGICDILSQRNKFTYITSISVNLSADIPKGMVCKTIPSSLYAVFNHRGSLSTLGLTYMHIYGTWLPNSKYEHANLPDIEVFDKNFNAKNCKNKWYINCPSQIYIPIIEKII